jgi:hypothetical protein
MFYTDEQLGPRQSLLPSGTLWARDVVVGRTGEQIYRPYEIGVDGDGLIRVQRDESEVFAPDAMASFEGAPVVLRHPAVDVTPSTWRALAVGHMQNVRRGDPPDDDKLVADLLIHDAKGIAAIRQGGWRAISLGYNAKYARDAAGRLRQVDIRGNHCAILSPQEEARCGAACMIGDAMPMAPAMTLDRAVAILRRHDGDLHEWAAAGAYLSSYYRHHRDRLTTDGATPMKPNPKMPARDYVAAMSAEWRRQNGTRDAIGPEYSSVWTPMGSDPGSRVGGELVQLLDDDRWTYYLGKDTATGRVGLFRYPASEEIGSDRYKGGPPSKTQLMADAQARDRHRARSSRSAAQQVSDFWSRQANG